MSQFGRPTGGRVNQLIHPCEPADSRTAGPQVRNAAEEYHAEFAAKETTIAALGAEAEAARARMQAEIEKLRSDMEVRPALTSKPWPQKLRADRKARLLWSKLNPSCSPRWARA